jgi:hypothetical protein
MRFFSSTRGKPPLRQIPIPPKSLASHVVLSEVNTVAI